jgi:hypothetical protein
MGSGKLFGGAKGAAGGAAAGSAFGPVGSIVGAGIGGGLGLFSSGGSKGRKSKGPTYTVPTYSQLMNSASYQNTYQQTLGQLRGQIDHSKALDSKAQTDELNARNQLGSSYEVAQRGNLDRSYSQSYTNAEVEANKQGLSSAINALPSVLQPYVSHYKSTSNAPSVGSTQESMNTNSGHSGQSINSLLNYITLGNVTRNNGSSSLGSRYWF